MAAETAREHVGKTTYQDRIKLLRKEITRKGKEVSKLLESNLDTILEEVVVNVDFSDHRRDKAFEMIELYFNLLGIPVNGAWVWNGLRTHGLAHETRDETGWGEHDYFIHLTEKGLIMKRTRGGNQNGS